MQKICTTDIHNDAVKLNKHHAVLNIA